jgi:hypothetical protein
MDFILFYSLMGIKNRLLVFSYDIACQWSRNLTQRLLQLPTAMRLSEEQLHFLRFVIPKFHIYAHGLACQCDFSLNFLRYMARMNGEDPERWWAHINPVSMSTKEMGPGARLDTLDDHAAAWNWRKITGFGMFINILIARRLMLPGKTLLEQLYKARTMSQRQQLNHDEFTNTFPSEIIQKWEKMVEDWHADPKAPNPYIEPITSKLHVLSALSKLDFVMLGTSVVSLCLELAKEEAAAITETGVRPHEMTPAMLIQNGLELEEQQCVAIVSFLLHSQSDRRPDD